MAGKPARLRVFVDAEVLFAGAASPSDYGASLVVLRLAEITLIDALASTQVITEAERNLATKLPRALPAFRLIVQRSLRVVPDPSTGDLAPHAGRVDPKDLPILVAAWREACGYLVTFNGRHYEPGLPPVVVVRPGGLIARIRGELADLSRARE